MLPIPMIVPSNRLDWNPSWGPTPNLWYATDNSNFKLDNSSYNDFITTATLDYTDTKNGLPVMSISSSAQLNTIQNPISSELITMFVVVKPAAIDASRPQMVIANYRLPSTTTYGQSSIGIQESGYIHGVSLYTTNANTTQTLVSIAATYSTSEWNVIVFKSDSIPAMTSSGTVNGRTMTTRSSIFTSIWPDNDLIIDISGSALRMAEVIVYVDNILNSTDTTSVENYLKSKWAITY